MIRSKQLEKVSPAQPSQQAWFQLRHRLGLASQRSTAAPSRRQTLGTVGTSSDTTDITLPALHHTLTALVVAVTVSHRHHSPLIDHCDHCGHCLA